jgi:hypothetical protein
MKTKEELKNVISWMEKKYPNSVIPFERLFDTYWQKEHGGKL